MSVWILGRTAERSNSTTLASDVYCSGSPCVEAWTGLAPGKRKRVGLVLNEECADMWRTMVQQSFDHVTVTIFDGSDERGHTVLVFRGDV